MCYNTIRKIIQRRFNMELKGFEKIKFKFKKMDFKNLGEVIKEKNYEKEMKKKIKPRTEPYEDVTDFKTVKEFGFRFRLPSSSL